MHPLQGASFLSTPLQGGILKPPALRVVDDFETSLTARAGPYMYLYAADNSIGPSIG